MLNMVPSVCSVFDRLKQKEMESKLDSRAGLVRKPTYSSSLLPPQYRTVWDERWD